MNKKIYYHNLTNELKEKKGSVHEFDAISEFISNSLASCKTAIDENKHKENVLIIDDLDRIDPEHVFRLLNIFSAHIDIDNVSNKFGFDKIIFVCDIENIQNIFAAKYGKNTNFSGYIDKFYSSEIFHFNNKDAIFEFVKNIMFHNFSKTDQKNFSQEELDYISNILLVFVKSGVINLRNIFANVKNLKTKKTGVGVIGRYRHYCIGYTLMWVCFRILGGQKATLIRAFEKAISSLNYMHNISPNRLACALLPLLTEDINDRVDSKEQQFSSFSKGNLKIEFQLHQPNVMSDCIYADNITPFITPEILKIIVIAAIEELDNQKLLI